MKRIRLKVIRTDNGETQADMAKRLGTTGANISRWEAEKTKPNIDTLIGICNEYGVSFPKLAPGIWEDILKIVELPELHKAIKDKVRSNE